MAARSVLVSAASRTDSTILTIFDYFLPCFFPMPLYLYLPVYKASYDLLLELFRFAKDFNREYKYTLGESIKKEIVEMITNIYRANSSYSKEKIIQSARENVEVIRLFLRLLKDLKQVNLEKFIFLNAA